MNLVKSSRAWTLLVLSLFISTGSLSLVSVAHAATLNVVSDAVAAPQAQIVLDAADRLVALQNANGSWDWVVTDAAGPTATTYYNVTGVTAQGLLDAYAISNNSSYLTAAVEAGDYLVGTPISTSQRQNAYNVVFLQDLAEATGNATYTTKTNDILSSIFTQDNYWSTASGGSHCTPTGCSVAQLVAAYAQYRAANRGLVAWDLAPFVTAEMKAGNTELAEDIEAAIVADAATYTPATANYDLGLAGQVIAAAAVNDLLLGTHVATLVARQDIDGSFGLAADGKVQTTAYALMGLEAAGSGAADAAAAYLVTNFGYASIDGWKDTDGTEYAETNSEAVHALGTQLNPGTFYSIKSAVAAASSGDTINVASGTYVENGQILIDKNLSIVGDDNDKPVIKPDANHSGTQATAVWMLVNSDVTFDLRDVVLDGDTFFVSVALRSHGNTTVDNVDFRNVQGSLTGSPYQGFAVMSFGGTIPGGAGSDTHSAGAPASILSVTDSTFTQIGRVGVLLKGTGSSATLSGNTYTGKGSGDFLDYGFEVGAGASATITENTISACRGVAASDGSTSAGILVTDYSGTGTEATISDNTISDCTAGVAVGYDETDNSVVVAHGNKFTNSDFGIKSTHPVVDATMNWWGDESGPTHASNPSGTGVPVTDFVTFDPWCTNIDCTVNHAPVANNMTVLVPFNTGGSFTLTASDPDGDEIEINELDDTTIEHGALDISEVPDVTY